MNTSGRRHDLAAVHLDPRHSRSPLPHRLGLRRRGRRFRQRVEPEAQLLPLELALELLNKPHHRGVGALFGRLTPS